MYARPGRRARHGRAGAARAAAPVHLGSAGQHPVAARRRRASTCKPIKGNPPSLINVPPAARSTRAAAYAIEPRPVRAPRCRSCCRCGTRGHRVACHLPRASGAAASTATRYRTRRGGPMIRQRTAATAADTRGGEPLLEVRGPDQALPGARRCRSAPRPRCARSTGVDFDVHAGRDARPGRASPAAARPPPAGCWCGCWSRPPGRSSSRAGTSPRSARRAMRPLRQDLQIIFQDPYSSLNPRHTVGKIVAMPLEVNGIEPPGGVKSAGAGAAGAGRPQPRALQPLSRTSSPAASASASASPARSRCARS